MNKGGNLTNKVVRCNFNENQCEKYFHLACAMQSKTFHWVSFRSGIKPNNDLKNKSSDDKNIFSPILRCTEHSNKQKTLSSLPSKLRNENIFERLITNFVFDEANPEADKCSVCFSNSHQNNDLFVICENPLCEIMVHQRCYGIEKFPKESWYCDVCKNGKRQNAQCSLCSFKGGALKLTNDKKWIHLSCALIDETVKIRNPLKMDSIEVQSHSKQLAPVVSTTCEVCRKCKTRGKLVSCSQNGCSSRFHALCALSSDTLVNFRVKEVVPKAEFGDKLQANPKLFLGEKSIVKSSVYCSNHSPRFFNSQIRWILVAKEIKFYSSPPMKECSVVKKKSDVVCIDFKKRKGPWKDELRQKTQSEFSFKKLTAKNCIDCIKLLEHLSLSNKKIEKPFKKGLPLLLNKNYKKFLSNFRPSLVKRAYLFSIEQQNEVGKTLGSIRCINPGCLKESHFCSLCSHCLSDVVVVFDEKKKSSLSIKPQKKALREELIMYSLNFIIQKVEKASKAALKKNGGDVIFLVRILLLKSVKGTKIYKKAKEIVILLTKIIEPITKIHDNSTPAELLVYLELAHALKDFGDTLQLKRRKQIKKSLSRSIGSSLISLDPLSKKPKLVDPYKCLKCLRKTPKTGKCLRCGDIVPQTIDINAMCETMIWLSVFEDIKVPFVSLDIKMELKTAINLIQWLRPYRNLKMVGENLYKKQCYLITHLIFILSSREDKLCWGIDRIDSMLLVDEFFFLVTNIQVVIDLKDPELVGEFLQCLRIFGLKEKHPSIVLGVNYLVDSVKSGKKFKRGGWVSTSNFYTMYHAAFCAIVGLADESIFPFEENYKRKEIFKEIRKGLEKNFWN